MSAEHLGALLNASANATLGLEPCVATQSCRNKLLDHIFSTLAVCVFLALCFVANKCWWRLQLRRALAGLPAAAADGSYLVVMYDDTWDVPKSRHGRVQLAGLATISEVVGLAVEYGAREVDDRMNDRNVEVKYMDLQGVERRVGAKTRLSDVRVARMLRISRGFERVENEHAGLMPRRHKKGDGKRKARRPRERRSGGADEEEGTDEGSMVSLTMPRAEEGNLDYQI